MGKISEALKKIAEERESLKKEIAENHKKETQKVADKDFSKKAPSFPYHPRISQEENRDSSQQKEAFEEKIEGFIQKYRQPYYLAKIKDSSGIDPRIVTYYDYASSIAEQYRTLRTNLKNILSRKALSNRTNLNKRPTRIFLITSALDGEGKTITSVNLAITMAYELEKKILLIDGDLRRGNIHSLLGYKETPGLSELLIGEVSLEEVFQDEKIKNLSVISRGRIPANPAELLGSRNMQRVFGGIGCGDFDYVIVDTPPALLFADPKVLASYAEGVALVVRAGKTQSHSVRKTKEFFEQAGVRILGFILTGVTDYTSRAYSYYYKTFSSKR